MPFPTAISSGQYDSLRGTSLINPTYYASDLVIFCPNVVIFAARLNGAPTGASYAQVTFDGTSIGAYTDIKVGQTVIIGSTSDIRQAEFTGIVRKAPTSTILYVNETSVSLPDNGYIWVINDYRLIDKLARQVGNTQYKFYDIAYQTTPPLIYGLQSAYAGIADATTHKLTLSFTPSALAITYGATISSWLWTIPSGVTITVGSTTTQNITVTVDAGTADWITVRARDSSSHDGYFHFFVASVPFDLSSVITPAVNGVTFSCNENGWTGSVTAFDGVDDILDNTLCVVLFTETYNNTVTNINGAVNFVGRIRKENDQTQTDETSGVVEQLTYDLEGALAQFSRVEHLPFTLRNTASPTVWDELTNLTIWRAIAYTLTWHSNFTELFSLTFDNTDLTYLYPLLPTQGGNIQAVIADLSVSLNATLESAATGETRVFRNALYQTTAQRNALTTVANYDDHDWIAFNLEVVEVDESGKVQASAGFFNNSSGIVTPLLSLAPGIAQGTGANITNLTRQVLASTTSQIAAQSELNTRAGNHYAIVQRPQPVITVTHPDGYTFITPSLSQWYTFTIAASENTGGRAFTSVDRWQCISYSLNHDSGLGTNEIQAVYRLESQGTPGQTVTYPAQGQIPPILPTIPPVPAFPSLPPLPVINLPPIPTPDDMPPYSPTLLPDGNLLGLISDIDVWNTPNALLTSMPAYNNISAADNLTFTCFQWVGMGFKGAYAIGNDGTDSTLFYSEDATISTPTWVGTVISGVYTLIRPTSTAGQLYIFGGGGGSPFSTTYDFSTGQHGWTILTSFGTYTGSAFQSLDNVFGQPPTDQLLHIQLTFSEQTVASVEVFYTTGAISNGGTRIVDWKLGASTTLAGTLNAGAGTFDDTISVNQSADGIIVAVDTAGLGSAQPVNTITKIIISGTSAPPFQSRYSTDFGATFASPQTIALVGQGADVVKVGDVVLACASGQVRKATSGGAWTDYGSALPAGFSPFAIWIPFFHFNSATSVNSETNPDYLIASSAVDGSGATLYKVTSTGAVFTDITPLHSAAEGLAVSTDCIAMPLKSGAKIAIIMSFSGTRRLQVSSNAATFTDHGAVGTGSSYLRYRRSDISLKQIFMNYGSTGIDITQDGGTTIVPKGNPSADAIIGIEPFG